MLLLPHGLIAHAKLLLKSNHSSTNCLKTKVQVILSKQRHAQASRSVTIILHVSSDIQSPGLMLPRSTKRSTSIRNSCVRLASIHRKNQRRNKMLIFQQERNGSTRETPQEAHRKGNKIGCHISYRWERCAEGRGARNEMEIRAFPAWHRLARLIE